ncbi:NUDIX hydrolase [Plantactinospora soyae]|uniref:ADP-ribose pyrophosphatase YjhB (NUDIX family) n=1 Tax=Plantactinospora soyae TaxID=1544732 RepID=A0A927R159_9ACTN|nr:NUDIX hydrolase [Plantactinospora soyae]MBE1489373.1 ADP-ribose pyrophosphatase YjhB (NUDIX family) [Plantactinospora soyae]
MGTHEAAPARPQVSAGAVFFDDDDRVLLVDPTYKKFWNLPGGAVDVGETPRAACVREVREELGLDPSIGPLLVVAWTANGPDGKLFFVFDGGVLPPDRRAAIVPAPGELAEYAFVPVERARRLLSEPQWILLTEVLAARADGVTRYVESGQV